MQPESANYKTVEENPAGACMMHVMQQFTSALPERGETFRKHYGVTNTDLDRARGRTFEHGFADLDFPWHFAALLASEITDFFIEQGKLTPEQRNNFTLQDWANIIGTGWFSRLSHMMALAPNGTYGTLGSHLGHYTGNKIVERLKSVDALKADDPLFNYSEQLEPSENLTYATASLSRAAIRGLRSNMQNKNSMGCPVARYSVLLPDELVTTDPHVKNLVNRNAMRRIDGRSNEEHVRFTQDWSAIDKTLAFFAWQLDDYERRYGTPYIISTNHRGIFLVTTPRHP